jgi:hypothetical protein
VTTCSRFLFLRARCVFYTVIKLCFLGFGCCRFTPTCPRNMAELSLCTPWRRMGEWRYSLTPNFDTSFGWVVNFTTRRLHRRGKRLRYSLNSRRGGFQSCSGRFWRRKDHLPLSGIERRFLGRTSRILVTIQTTLSWLPYIGGVRSQVNGVVSFERFHGVKHFLKNC